jgi:hypothetical protein
MAVELLVDLRRQNEVRPFTLPLQRSLDGVCGLAELFAPEL